jgi:hypothetical protein
MGQASDISVGADGHVWTVGAGGGLPLGPGLVQVGRTPGRCKPFSDSRRTGRHPMGILSGGVTSVQRTGDPVRRLGERIAAVADELKIIRKLLYEWRAAYRRLGAAVLNRKCRRKTGRGSRQSGRCAGYAGSADRTGASASAYRPVSRRARAAGVRKAPTHAFDPRPLSRAFRPFAAPILKGSKVRFPSFHRYRFERQKRVVSGS